MITDRKRETFPDRIEARRLLCRASRSESQCLGDSDRLPSSHMPLPLQGGPRLGGSFQCGHHWPGLHPRSGPFAVNTAGTCLPGGAR